VGREEEPFRIRRASFPYDAGYPGEALPVLRVEFRSAANSPGVLLDRVVADTGADSSVLPWADCQRLQLATNLGFPSTISGIGGAALRTISYQLWAHLDGHDYACQIQVDFGGSERILGRDVLNRMDVLFRGPSGEIAVNP
jgi:hypothetical protein